jgi:hypothetical protein
LNLSGVQGEFEVKWYDPRHGGELQSGTVKKVAGGGLRSLGGPPREPGMDWAVLVRRAPDPIQSLGKERRFHVKLVTPIGARISRAGDRVSASVISPEVFLGATLEGVVEQVSGNSVTLVFRSLVHKGGTVGITSTTTDFVNSKGHKLVDDREQPTRVAAGAFVGGADFWMDEGAEIRLVVSPSSRN